MNTLPPPEKRKYVRFKVKTPDVTPMTQAEFAQKMRDRANEVGPKAIAELTRQYEEAKSEKRKEKLEARIKEWLKLMAVVAKDEFDLKNKKE